MADRKIPQFLDFITPVSGPKRTFHRYDVLDGFIIGGKVTPGAFHPDELNYFPAKNFLDKLFGNEFANETEAFLDYHLQRYIQLKGGNVSSFVRWLRVVEKLFPDNLTNEFVKEWIESKLKEVDSDKIEQPSSSRSSDLPYPTIKEYSDLADILSYEDTQRIYGEIIKDWIGGYRINRETFLLRFRGFIDEQYEGDKKGKVAFIFKQWSKNHGRDFLNESPTKPARKNLKQSKSKEKREVQDYVKDWDKFLYVIGLLIEHEEEFIIQLEAGKYLWNYNKRGTKAFFAAFIEVLLINGYITKPDGAKTEYALAFCPFFGLEKVQSFKKNFQPTELGKHHEKRRKFDFIPNARDVNT